MLCLDTDLGVLSGGGIANFLAYAEATSPETRYATSSNGAIFSQTFLSSAGAQRASNGWGAFYQDSFYVPSQTDRTVTKLNINGIPSGQILVGSGGSSMSVTAIGIRSDTGRMVVSASNSSTKSIFYADPPYSSFTQVSGFDGTTYEVKYLNGTWVLVAANSSGQTMEIWTSSDNAASWTKRLSTSNNASGTGGSSLVYANGHYICAGGGNDVGTKPYFYSSNGTTWTAIDAANTLSSVGTRAFFGCVYKASNSTFYVYSTTNVAYATNPSSNNNWTLSSLTSSGFDKVAISGDNIVLAGTGSNSLKYSTSGISFSNSAHPFGSANLQCLVGV